MAIEGLPGGYMKYREHQLQTIVTSTSLAWFPLLPFVGKAGASTAKEDIFAGNVIS